MPLIEPLDPRVLLSSVPLHVSGTHVVDPSGHVIQLRGVDLDSLEYKIAGDHVLQSLDTAIRDWHATLIRLPMNENFWFGYNFSSSPGDGGAAYRSLIDQIVKTVSDKNVYVALDLHWSNMDVWGSNNGQHEMPDDNSALFWQSVAARYANNPAVWFDLYNEPHNISWPQWKTGGNFTEGSVTYHSPGMQGLLNRVRAAGANNIVAASGVNWAGDLNGVVNGFALSDSASNLIYQAHIYPYDNSNQKVSDWDNHVAATAAQYAVYVGEFGTDDAGTSSHFIGQPTPQAWVQTMLSWLEQHHYTWTAWSFNPQTHPILLSDWSYNPTAYYGTYVKAALAAATGPKVAGVSVSGTGWTELPYAIPSGSQQLLDLPWANLDRISIRFSENVNVAASDLTVTGSNMPMYASRSFTYDPSTFTASWTLGQAFGPDRLRLEFSGATDATNSLLDGEWADGTSSFPSGSGTAGGEFVFSLNVMPGDINRDGKVDFQDLVILAGHYGAAGTFSDGDLNGDGSVGFDDLVIVARNYSPSSVSAAAVADHWRATPWRSHLAQPGRARLLPSRDSRQRTGSAGASPSLLAIGNLSYVGR